ncbi:hypothetical protein ACHQM5_017036 [Ranunculus cassubicifolius]
METGGGPPKAAKPTNTSQETPTPTPYPDWTAPMQAYYAAGAAQPPFFPSAVATPGPYPYMWGAQPMVSPYGAPIPYPGLYPHGGLYPHPNMTAAQGAAVAPVPAPMEGKGTPVKEVKSAGNIGLVDGKPKGNGKATSGSGNDGASQSAESGSEESSDGSDENITHKGKSTKKKHSFDQMLADGATVASSLNEKGEPSANLTIPFPGNSAGATNMNMGIELWNASPIGGVPVTGRSNPSGVLPAVVPVARGGREGTGSDHLWVQDERELKRQRRKLSNRESARRSRLRKQAECEELQVKVESLSDENTNLRKELERLAEERQKLAIENTSLVGELSQLYGEDAISSLKGKNDNTSVLQSIYGQGNGHDQDTSRGNNSLSD